MSGRDRLFLQLDGGVAGPYTPTQVRELAEGTLVTPATPAALSREGPWLPVGDLPQAGEIFPPKAALGFKPAAFENLNSGAAPSAPLPMSGKSESVLALKSSVPGAPAVGAADSAGVTDPDAPPNNVREMVDEVAAIEASIAPPPPPPKPWRPSGRLQLVAALALLGNGVVCAIPFFYDTRDVFSETILRGWFAIFNGGLVLIYFQLPKD